MGIFEKFRDLENESKEFGFYWLNQEMIIARVKSELSEVQTAINQNESPNRIQEEIGDVLHAAFSLCIYLGFDIKQTLENAANKYEKRFKALQERTHKEGLSNLKTCPVEKKLKLWEEVKHHP